MQSIQVLPNTCHMSAFHTLLYHLCATALVKKLVWECLEGFLHMVLLNILVRLCLESKASLELSPSVPDMKFYKYTRKDLLAVLICLCLSFHVRYLFYTMSCLKRSFSSKRFPEQGSSPPSFLFLRGDSMISFTVIECHHAHLTTHLSYLKLSKLGPRPIKTHSCASL